MKYRYALLPLLLGLFLGVVGALFKMLHWPGSNWLQLAGLVGFGGTLVLILLRLVRGPGAS